MSSSKTHKVVTIQDFVAIRAEIMRRLPPEILASKKVLTKHTFDDQWVSYFNIESVVCLYV